MAKWEQLAAARERMHLSQLEAAERVNVGVVTYQRWEAGKTKPQPQHMRHLYVVFKTLLEQCDEITSQEVCLPYSFSASITEKVCEEMPVGQPIEETDTPQAFITAHMATRLWSLTFLDHPTYHDKRSAIRQSIKEFDSMNTNNKNYQITRREALCSLATLPMITLGLTAPGKVIQSSQYGNALAQCAASLEACWELSKSSDASDLSLAFKSTLKYTSLLQTISKDSPHYHTEALDLATRYTLLKTILGWHCTGPTETIQYAKDAVALSEERGDTSLQLSAYSKLAWAYFYNKQYAPALTAAQRAEMLLQRHHQLSNTEPLFPSIQGGTYSTLALMQVKNGKSSDIALGKAIAIDPGDDIHAFFDFTRSTMLIEASWIYCYQGNQSKAMETLAKRVDPTTFSPKMPQSEIGRVETINIMTLSSLKTKDRDLEKTIRFWQAAIEGAKALQSEYSFKEALTNYELMEIVWPGERRVAELHDQVVHWE